MRRRDFLTGAAGLAGIAVAPPKAGAACPAPGDAVATPGAYLVPGYRTDIAYWAGRPVAEAAALRGNLPAGYDGPLTLLTRLSEADGTLRRTLMPIRGHAVTLRPGSELAVWNSMRGETLLSFDPVNLEIASLARFADGFVGGGHVAFIGDGAAMATTERRPEWPYAGSPEAHRGRVTIRDSADLRVLETYDAHGMAPHDIKLLADAKHLVIANYGSFIRDGEWRPELVEPSLTVLELASGKLVDKRVNPDPACEVRHLAAHSPERTFAITARRGSFAEEQALLADCAEVYEPDDSSFDDGAFLPAPVQRFDLSRAGPSAPAGLPDDPLVARQGQSMLYDPIHDEVIATFTSSHRLIVFTGGDGGVRRVIPTEPFGLRQPRGIVLHPDGVHYAVSGSWSGLFLFRRGSHAPVPARTLQATFFDHSHMAVAPI